jgi:peptidoglycan/xylan/chitin deacetylase (PgdA/CDA1 family)
MNTVYLTFDDGPDPEFTPRVLDALGEADMRATFFTIGAQVRRRPELVRRIAAEGHELGNHSFNHRHPWFMSDRAARAEVRDGAAALSDTIGRSPRFFRPPHGRMRACMTEEAQSGGQRTVLWNLSAIDWGPFGRAPKIAQRLARIKAGDIVLMHDGCNEHNRPDELLKVLPALLAELQQRGLRSAALPVGV